MTLDSIVKQDIFNKSFVLSVNIGRKGDIKKPVAFVRVSKLGIIGDGHYNTTWPISAMDYREIKLFELKNNCIQCFSYGDFCENITFSYIPNKVKLGVLLYIDEVVLKLVKIGKAKCHTSCSVYNRFGVCLAKEKSLFFEVLQEGIIKKGSVVKWIM